MDISEHVAYQSKERTVRVALVHCLSNFDVSKNAEQGK
jgi:hypothetical protein